MKSKEEDYPAYKLKEKRVRNSTNSSSKRTSPEPIASTSTPKKVAFDAPQNSESKDDESRGISSPGLSAGIKNIRLDEPSSSQHSESEDGESRSTSSPGL